MLVAYEKPVAHASATCEHKAPGSTAKQMSKRVAYRSPHRYARRAALRVSPLDRSTSQDTTDLGYH